MEFFYSDGVQSLGPFPLEQLKTKNITRSTMVWHTGMADWKPAGEVAELSALFSNSGAVQNPTTPYVPNVNAGAIPKTWLVESILVTLFCCQPFGVIGIVYAALVESAISTGNYSEANRLSKSAGKWTKIAFFSGLAFYVIFGIFYFAIFMSVLKNAPGLQNF